MSNTKSVKLMAVGDVMLGDHPICIGHGVRSLIEKKGSEFIFREISGILNNADITFGNLESVLSNIRVDKSNVDSLRLRGTESSVNGLVYAGFNVMSLANNHILEHGYDSLVRTIDLLEDNGIKSAGVAENNSKSHELVVIERNGISFGFLAYCLINDSTAYCSIDDIDEIIDDVRKRKDKVDNLIVSLHWGNEYIRKPSPQQVQLGHSIIDAGADLILGHHPHVLQGVEKYKEGIIAYSLGNFVFDMWQRKMRESMILSLDFSKNKVEKFKIIPIIIDKDNFQPRPLHGFKKEKLKDKITNDFLEKLDENKYFEELQSCKNRYRFDLIRHIILNFYKYYPLHLYKIILNFFKK
ncbi:MAG: CapA family protein [archaeon]